MNVKTIILHYFNDVHRFTPTDQQFEKIVNRQELVKHILNNVPIEWEWTVSLKGTCFSCCKDGAKSWILDNLEELFTVSVGDVEWNPSWQIIT